MDFTQRLPSEIFLAIFKELDVKTLCSLSLVSKECNSFAIDNHVWYNLALRRWEGKQGMTDIHSEHHEMWFKKAGTWKKVYGIVEQEARRSELSTDDLAETTWCFKFNSFQLPHIGTPKFHRNGIYTHHEMIDGQLPWAFTNEGRVRVDQFPPLKPYRSTTDWSLRMRNVHVTFVSTDLNCFRKRLYQFNLNLIKELGLDPFQYVLKTPEPLFNISNSLNKGNESDEENDQETESEENDNDNEGRGDEERTNVAMDHIMVLPSHHVFHDGDNDNNRDENVHRGRYVILLSFQN